MVVQQCVIHGAEGRLRLRWSFFRARMEVVLFLPYFWLAKRTDSIVGLFYRFHPGFEHCGTLSVVSQKQGVRTLFLQQKLPPLLREESM